ncbi:MAG: hypothetical protein RL354_956 [Planctomycetota bacterium]
MAPAAAVSVANTSMTEPSARSTGAVSGVARIARFRGYTPPAMPLRRALASLALLLPGVLGSVAAAQSVDVELLHLGVGDVVRGGGPIAAQLQFRSSLDRPAEIEAVWELPNADLDVVEHARRFVLNPGQAQRRWLYGVLPPDGEGALQGAVYDLRLYEIEGGERVRDLGTVKLGAAVASNPPRPMGLADDALLVVGARSVGLDIFAQAGPSGAIPSMNGGTVIANVRDPDALPDRWEGLAVFDAIVWADGSIAPSRLSEESSRAIEQWVERGGNLVIVLPSAGDPWAIGVDGRHRMSSLLPSVAPERIDDVPLREILPMLSLSETLRDASVKTRLAVFDPAALDRGWRPFVATPAPKAIDGSVQPDAGPFDGKVVGVRRQFGFGHMTLVGVDIEELSSRALQVPTLPQGDVFWNRVLGRRADTPSGGEYTALAESTRLVTSGGVSAEIGENKLVSETIGLAGQAAIGVLAATAVFGLYWLVAGPLGFALLKSTKRERWAWVAYVGVAAVFTGGILLVGASLSGRKPLVSHLTVLDAIERGPGQSDVDQELRRRATSWVSVFVPTYGEAEIAIDPAAEARAGTGPKPRNLLSSWRASGTSVESFPSRERYAAPLDAPSRAVVPSRATTVDFKARWLGAVRDGWGGLPRATEPVSATIDATGPSPTIALSGTLVHDLPGTLRDVRVIHIWPRQNPLPTLGNADPGQVAPRRFPAQLPNRGEMRSLPPWAPGDSLDLAKVFEGARPLSNRLGLEESISKTYTEDLAQRIRTGIGLVTDTVGLVESLEMLSMYGMLPPPQYLRSSSGALDTPFRVVRTGGRELDLSEWFTQPCLIVLGWLEADLPYELTLDGARVEGGGRVLVRWIMPLPADPAWVVPEKFPRAAARNPA